MRVIILLGLLGSSLAVPRNPNRIVGGTETNVETYPYMSKVQVSTFGISWSQFCGGSLITSTAVLSAAHCYIDDFRWRYRIVLGTSLASTGGTVHTINRIIMHPQYVPETLDNDVAIVRLNNPAVFSDRIQTARIPGPNYNLDDGATVTHVGWGQLYYGGPGSEQLMHVHVNIINQQLCAERYAYLKTQPDYENHPQVTSSMVCAGILDVGGKDACGGDSGGPLAHFGDIIVGVTSWGHECADPFYPGVSVRVSHFTDWIVANATVPRNPSRIVGGTETNVETYPYMSKVQVSTFGISWSQFCGGSLITSTAVLSAAHCYFDDFRWRYRIVLGTSLASSGGTVHTINRIIMHPQYVPETLDNDVAIVRLNNPAVFSDRIQTARIPGPNYNLDDGATVTHVGWGQLYYGGPVSEQLMHVHVNVINQQLCAERYAYLKTQPDYEDAPQITDGMVCAGIIDVGGKDACGGDSGGPLAHFGDIIVGVTSWSFECADPLYPGVSVRVSHFTDWIVANAS